MILKYADLRRVLAMTRDADHRVPGSSEEVRVVSLAIEYGLLLTVEADEDGLRRRLRLSAQGHDLLAAMNPDAVFDEALRRAETLRATAGVVATGECVSLRAFRLLLDEIALEHLTVGRLAARTIEEDIDDILTRHGAWSAYGRNN